MSWNSKRFTVLFSAGVVILIIGLLLQWYPSSVVSGLEERLSHTDLSIDEQNKLEGELNSWQIWQITTFNPLSSILIAAGIIMVVYSVISTTFSIATSYKVVRKAEE